MKKILLAMTVLFLFSGCAEKTAQVEKNNPEKAAKVYSVDEFVTDGFKEGNKLLIGIKSVTCYNNTCAVEDGAKWGMNMDEKDSKAFYPYAGKSVDMVIQADSGCDKNAAECHTIKNVSIVRNNSREQKE